MKDSFYPSFHNIITPGVSKNILAGLLEFLSEGAHFFVR